MNCFFRKEGCVKRKKKEKGKKARRYIEKQILGNHRTVGMHMQYTVRILGPRGGNNIAQHKGSSVYGTYCNFLKGCHDLQSVPFPIHSRLESLCSSAGPA